MVGLGSGPGGTWSTDSAHVCRLDSGGRDTPLTGKHSGLITRTGKTIKQGDGIHVNNRGCITIRWGAQGILEAQASMLPTLFQDFNRVFVKQGI